MNRRSTWFRRSPYSVPGSTRLTVADPPENGRPPMAVRVGVVGRDHGTRHALQRAAQANAVPREIVRSRALDRGQHRFCLMAEGVGYRCEAAADPHFGKLRANLAVVGHAASRGHTAGEEEAAVAAGDAHVDAVPVFNLFAEVGRVCDDVLDLAHLVRIHVEQAGAEHLTGIRQPRIGWNLRPGTGV